MLSRSLVINNCVAVKTAITAGSFPFTSAKPIDKRVSKALSRQARGAHLAQEARPLRRRPYEADIAEPIRAQGLRDNFEIDRVRMGHDDNQRAVGRIREFVRRLGSLDQRDIRRRVRSRKSLATRVDPANRERRGASARSTWPAPNR